MIKILKLIFITICLFSCQKQTNEFHINGEIEAGVDSINMYPGFIAKDFLDIYLQNGFKSKVDNGKFFFKGKLDYPHMFSVYSRTIGGSEIFFIENGNYDLKIGLLERNDRDVLITKSKTQIEYESLKSKKLDSIQLKIWRAKTKKEIQKFRIKKDSIILNHLKITPNSYVALWLLIENYCLNGYNTYQKESLDYFSNKIKKTSLYLTFEEKIKEAENFSFVNRKMPLHDINLKLSQFDIRNFKNSKYILIDFWFSHCGPCLVEMPKYKPIYNKYKEKGFEIVSISSELIKDIPYWKKIILENEFNWVHYLDKNREETRKLNINSYPTTFLVDNKGNIITKNVSIEELEDFLNKNLNGNIPEQLINNYNKKN